MSTNISLACNVQGWMAYEELEWLAEQASTHERILEIGSYLGRSTRALADNTTGMVVAIDDFLGPRDMALPPAIRNNIEELFLYNVGDLIPNKLKYYKADHRLIDLDIIPDMVFIDGGHTYRDVKFDIKKWLPKLEKGGLICGHDYTNMYEVQKAVNELVKNFKIAEGTSIWYAINK